MLSCALLSRVGILQTVEWTEVESRILIQDESFWLSLEFQVRLIGANEHFVF